MVSESPCENAPPPKKIVYKYIFWHVLKFFPKNTHLLSYKVGGGKRS